MTRTVARVSVEESKLRPGGKLPFERVHWYGPTPSLAVTVPVYEEPTLGAGMLELVIETARATVIVKAWVALRAGVPLSTTRSVKVYVPAVVGVPARWAAAAGWDKTTPGGSAPAETLHV